MPNTAHQDDNVISLGNHSTDCFGNVTLCPNGITFSLWFKVEAAYGEGSHVFQSTCLHAFIKKMANGNLQLWATLKNGTHRLKYESFSLVTPNVWHQLGFTYSSKHEFNVWYDGNIHDNVKIVKTPSPTMDFELGCSNRVQYCIRIIFDDLKFWKVWKNHNFMKWLWNI